MKIDPNKVLLTEHDIESWLWENPHAIQIWDDPWIDRWLARQYPLPSGVADLIGVTHHGFVAVVEVKNVPIRKEAITQICRYAWDVEQIVQIVFHEAGKDWETGVRVYKVLVGPSIIDEQTWYEAEACGIRVFLFAVQLNLQIEPMQWWTTERYERQGQRVEAAARDMIWDFLRESTAEAPADEGVEPTEAEIDERQANVGSAGAAGPAA